ncbi:hypothetical protein Tco_0719042 [Tanacetum coccineum]
MGAPEVARLINEDERAIFTQRLTPTSYSVPIQDLIPLANNAPEKKPNPTHRRAPGEVTRPNSGEVGYHVLRAQREAPEKAFEASKDKDETIKSLEELRFLALSTKDLSDDDAFWILRKKNQIKAKLRAEMPMEPNNEDDSDE